MFIALWKPRTQQFDVVLTNSTTLFTTSETFDFWSASLGAIDVNGDGRSELVVGAPAENQGTTNDVGTATLLWAGPHGLTTTGAAFYKLDNAGDLGKLTISGNTFSGNKAGLSDPGGNGAGGAIYVQAVNTAGNAFSITGKAASRL